MPLKKPPPTHKATPTAVQTRQKTKKVVSTSALFAQIPRLKAAVAPLKPQPSTKKPQPRKAVAVIIPKRAPEHPLMGEFNETTTAYATSLLSEASAKLVSTRDSLIKRLNDASTDTLLSASEKNLRTQLAKPFPSTPNITALKTVVDREAAALALLKKDYSAVTGEINALAREIFDTNDSQGQGGMQKGPYIPRTKLDQELLEKVRQIQNEIAVLGDEEIKELEKEKKVAKNKKLKIAQFFMGLDEDE